MARTWKVVGWSGLPPLLSILISFTLELMPVCKAEAQSADPSLWQQVTSSPDTYIVAPAVLNQFLPFEGVQTFSTATLGPATSVRAGVTSASINSVPSSQALQSPFASVSKLRSTSALTNVMVSVAGGLLVGSALYQGVKCSRSNHKIKQDALLAQKEYIIEQQTLLAQRQALNEKVAEAAASAWQAEGTPVTVEVLVHSLPNGTDDHVQESCLDEKSE